MNNMKSGWEVVMGAVVALALGGCSGQVDVGSDPAAGGSAGSAGSGASGAVGASDPAGGSSAGSGMVTPFDPTQEPDGTCPATCADAAGSVQDLPNPQAFFTAIVGRWLICGDGRSAFGGAPADVIGVEYMPPTVQAAGYAPNGILRGDMFYLVNGANGPERGQGFDYQLTYDVGDDAKPWQLNMHPSPNSGFGGSFKYSPCPREWQLDGGSANPGQKAILVPSE